ncbi:AbrB/MazE/SpoVT family DNA-binding domain-containing protein [Candidatus Methylospira mobilis]|uniref:AbrB/MazE/SpoVT family DNA-binding domain-containing protein n=1 Tax=Candidatus Methylospira mobilis TaxID=1808979 RepID=A0A5Q0BPN1_9GAMM|nr:AbrB/MazE/SpoVT family DNA-binding domain-containing protein [Candidatus Methylospira mobilis]
MAFQVSQGGQIVIPAEICRKMGLSSGDQVLLRWSDEACQSARVRCGDWNACNEFFATTVDVIRGYDTIC